MKRGLIAHGRHDNASVWIEESSSTYHLETPKESGEGEHWVKQTRKVLAEHQRIAEGPKNLHSDKLLQPSH